MQGKYCDMDMGVYLIRGENITMLGEIDEAKDASNPLMQPAEWDEGWCRHFSRMSMSHPARAAYPESSCELYTPGHDLPVTDSLFVPSTPLQCANWKRRRRPRHGPTAAAMGRRRSTGTWRNESGTATAVSLDPGACSDHLQNG